jgi:hypothetical protein
MESNTETRNDEDAANEARHNNVPIQVPNEESLSSSPMGPDDPQRMRLTRQERSWALEIKEVVELIPELDNLSDFQYAEMALICKEDIGNALRRIEALQDFKQKYDVLHSLEDGSKAVRHLIQLFPKVFLFFGFSHSDGAYAFAVDRTHYEPSTCILRARDENHWFAGAYYQLQALAPDLESTRKGSIHLQDGGRIHSKRGNQKEAQLMTRLSNELYKVYPCNQGIHKQYQTGIILSTMTTVIQDIVPPMNGSRRMSSRKSESDDPVKPNQDYVVSSVETSNQRVLESMEAALMRRYANERTFVL